MFSMILCFENTAFRDFRDADFYLLSNSSCLTPKYAILEKWPCKARKSPQRRKAHWETFKPLLKNLFRGLPNVTIVSYDSQPQESGNNDST